MGLAGVKCPLSVEGLEQRGRDMWTKGGGGIVVRERGKE